MAIRQPVSIPSPTLDKLRAIRLAEGGGTYGQVIDRAVEALLAQDKALAGKVEKILAAVAA